MADRDAIHWKEEYENASVRERNQFARLDVEALIQKVREGVFGDYFGIWYAIADNATLRQAGWTLYSILTSNVDYLYRYHAAAALIKLLRSTLEPVALSAKRPTLEANLATVREELLRLIGPPV